MDDYPRVEAGVDGTLRWYAGPDVPVPVLVETAPGQFQAADLPGVISFQAVDGAIIYAVINLATFERF